MAENVKTPMTMDQIRKINLRYQGKPENFKKPSEKQQPKEVKPQRSATLPPPHDQSRRKCRPLATFTPTYARLPSVAQEVYSNLPTDDGSINKKLTTGMVNYYATTLLWARSIHLKAKRAQTPLSQTELDFKRYFTETEFNVPQPLAVYLRSIDNTTDERKKGVLVLDG